MRLDPTSLKLFVAVVEQGTIAAAAQKEHIAASAVSKRISELEQLFAVPLLDRTNRGIQATVAGKTLLTLSRGVLNELDEVCVQMKEYSHGMRGEIRVVANISAIAQFLPDQLNAFLKQYPQVQIHLQEQISSEITRSVANNLADIGIFTLAPHACPELEIYPYASDQLVLITSTDHSLASADAVRFSDTLVYDYVGLHTGSAINQQLASEANRLDKALKLRIQVTSYDALCRMVEAGLGIGVMPSDVALPFVKTGRIRAIPILESWAQRDLKICVREPDALPVATRLLLTHLTKHCK